MASKEGEGHDLQKYLMFLLQLYQCAIYVTRLLLKDFIYGSKARMTYLMSTYVIRGKDNAFLRCDPAEAKTVLQRDG